MKSVHGAIVPAIIDIGKVVAAITRNQALKNDIETICNDLQGAVQDIDEEKNAATKKLQQGYPQLQFNNR